jgi:uncharacterized protein YqjF (DUF2071 family)
MAQTLNDQLFAHWRVPAAALREHVPEGLEVDEHDGSGWVGITPFEITGLRARGLLPLPLVSSFRELNVRTCVTRDGRPGIWFFSLDASSQVAVEAARRLYRLPYFRAQITLQRRAGRIIFESVRREGKAFSCAYRPAGRPASAEPGSLEYFLTERYCLYTMHRGTICSADIHHRPWPLQPATATIDLNTMPPEDMRLTGEPLLHYSARQDVLVWPLKTERRPGD